MSTKGQALSVIVLIVSGMMLAVLFISFLEPAWLSENIRQFEKKNFAWFWGSVAILQLVMAVLVWFRARMRRREGGVIERANELRLVAMALAVSLFAGWVWYVGPAP